MFKVRIKGTSEIVDIYAVTQMSGGCTCFLEFNNDTKTWSWMAASGTVPYIEPSCQNLLDTDEFAILKINICIDGSQYDEFYVRKTMDEADRLVNTHMCNHRTDDGKWIQEIDNICYYKEMWTVVQLRAFLTVDEFKELGDTGMVGEY